MQFPALNRLSKLPSYDSDIDFSQTVLIAVQHLLASNGSVLQLLNDIGLDYDRMFLHGKAYSTNEEVYAELQKRNVNLNPNSLHIGKLSLAKDYKLELRKSIGSMLPKAIAKLDALGEGARLLVVDDGGVLIEAVSSSISALKNRQIVAVEQTRSGVETIRNIKKLPFPIINVAESKKKLQDESPYIAESIVGCIKTSMSELPVNPVSKCSTLVVGHGAIGKNVSKVLREMCKLVKYHDIADLGPRVTIPKIDRVETEIGGFDLIVGCVGKPWLNEKAICNLKNGVVLASGSSSNSEFIGLSMNAESTYPPNMSFQNADLKQIHSDYAVKTNSGLAFVLNAGFPVNFDGSQDPIEPNIVELTRMLMINGIIQACTQALPSKGLIALKPLFELR